MKKLNIATTLVLLLATNGLANASTITVEKAEPIKAAEITLAAKDALSISMNELKVEPMVNKKFATVTVAKADQKKQSLVEKHAELAE